MNLTELGWCDRTNQHFATLTNGSEYVAARVALEYRRTYRIYTEQGELPAQLSGQFRHQAADLSAFPAVGDWVAVQLHDDGTHATIHQVLPRQSQFARKAAGGKTEAQVVAANIDTVFLVSGLDGDFNLRRIERSLVLAWESGANPVIVLNKADDCEDLETRLEAVEGIALGVPVVPISALTGSGIEALEPYLQPGQTVALIGSSGVGKSTLTNSLLGDSLQETRAVRANDQRGRHTTTHRHLLRLPSGALLIDTPGMRELQLWSTAEGLETAFSEVETLAQQCRFRDCQHQQEPGCAVQAAIATGDLDPARLHSYHKLQREQRHLAERQDSLASLNTKRRWKAIHKAMRHDPKRR
ncbi:ribosome small subunit-dependent GTPase A [Pseudanabaena sp. FACHB-2040]|uniref:ribosome small subunit-dependent GTPase A n=1 Tax=Pseudanabaena sp. FACHB-2040 TaxID=2692859 RepID=UPI001688D25D|nr:ribosome small subunit-dependent GTPase A [Pseudanabaena sp. FACHB-2040]MBD2256082.1 ribosome small subunit-dependent GTPase A [Pseudanabaena sp. FACHB-2040]